MSVKKVYLIRHGETDYNRDHRLQGVLPVPLNDKGRLQAEALGQYLKVQKIDAIFSSHLSRAKQTADIVGRALNLSVSEEPLLGEIAFGIFEGLTFSEIQATYPDAYRMWDSGDMSYVVPDGESRQSAQKRMSKAWDDITAMTDYETIVMMTHGSAMKILLRYMYYRIPDKYFENTSITTLIRFQQVWEIESIAETPHLID